MSQTQDIPVVIIHLEQPLEFLQILNKLFVKYQLI